MKLLAYWFQRHAGFTRVQRHVGFILSLLLFFSFGAFHLMAQDPGQQQDAEAERTKILKAADQLDMIETGYETTRVTIDTLKTQVTQLTQGQTRLEQENEDLKTQVAALEDQLKHSEDTHAAEQKELLAQVAELIANSMSKSKSSSATSHTKIPKTHPQSGAATNLSAPTPDPNGPYSPPTPSPSVASHVKEINENPPDPTLVGSGTDVVQPPTDTPPAPIPPPVKTPPPAPPTIVEHGYNHVVAEGETLTEIARAYREQGVKVTVADIRKANNLTPQSVLKVGQKLFIPRI